MSIERGDKRELSATLKPKRHSSQAKLPKQNPAQKDDQTLANVIAEDEDDKLSDNSDTAAARKIVKKELRKNLLCKNLFD